MVMAVFVFVTICFLGFCVVFVVDVAFSYISFRKCIFFVYGTFFKALFLLPTFVHVKINGNQLFKK